MRYSTASQPATDTKTTVHNNHSAKLLPPGTHSLSSVGNTKILHSPAEAAHFDAEDIRPLLPAWLSVVATIVLAAILLPLFICAPVTSDTSLFDVQAMTVLKGGVLYRDIVEPNLPGIVWVHLGLRTLIGWSSEAIRIADFCIFTATMLLLANLVVSSGSAKHRNSRAGMFIFTSSLFYLTRNEWCHCQRDIWMLLPVSCAIWLRSTRSDQFRHLPYCNVIEGIFWGIAFWIKPHVAIPAISVILIDAVCLKNWKLRATDTGGIILGGVLAAIPGIVWLISTGAWEHFWTMMLQWNPEYLEAGRNRRDWNRVYLLLQRFHPWWAIHVVAVPLAVQTIVAAFRATVDTEQTQRSIRSMFSACYLSWLLQAFLLQHAMDYIHVPEVLLAICVIAAHPWQLDLQLRRVATAALLGLALLATPQFHNGRMTAWAHCFTEGSSPEIRGLLAQGNYPDWNHIHQVEDFLHSRNVADGEVACLNVHCIHLHQELAILPATRFWSINCLLTMFPKRYDEIMATVAAGKHRFVVVEANESNQKDQILPKSLPGNLPVVFESGTYRVYETRVQEVPPTNNAISTAQK